MRDDKKLLFSKINITSLEITVWYFIIATIFIHCLYFIISNRPDLIMLVFIYLMLFLQWYFVFLSWKDDDFINIYISLYYIILFFLDLLLLLTSLKIKRIF